jgi:hypothetical protein
MVQIRQLDEDSLLPILEQDPATESKGSTETITETVPDLVLSSATPSKGFFGGIFMISRDSAPIDVETNEQHVAREARNTNRAQRHREANTTVNTRAATIVATIGPERPGSKVVILIMLSTTLKTPSF